MPAVGVILLVATLLLVLRVNVEDLLVAARYKGRNIFIEVQQELPAPKRFLVIVYMCSVLCALCSMLCALSQSAHI